ncbi:MAG: hypothetical protein V2I67_19720 [Thermoanaerobaculales bacterium]|jgi:hypothetical protein|nr:hypothetical protein [Thermoanaerobaculales bacterium]
MKHNLTIGMVVAAALLIALPAVAQDVAAEGRRSCPIEGTWYGTNSAAFNFVFQIEKNAAGGYSGVADGFAYLAPGVQYCTAYTAWRGELAKIAPGSYLFRQVELCDPTVEFLYVLSQAPFNVVIDPGTVLVWASEGTLTLQGCNQLLADIPFNGAYELGSGDVPFDDVPVVNFGYVEGTFYRMPRP